MQQGQLFQQYHQQHGVYLRGPDSEGSTNNTNTTPSPISPGIGLAMSTSPAGSVNAPQSHTSGEGYASGGNHPAGRDRAVGGSASGAGQSPPGNASNNETSASASAAGAGGKKRKWSVEERQLHSVIEKKRRETLNAKLLVSGLPFVCEPKIVERSRGLSSNMTTSVLLSLPAVHLQTLSDASAPAPGETRSTNS